MFTIGFLGGMGTCLVALKVLPVSVRFNWNKDEGILAQAKKKAGVLHPKYCAKCKENPCQDPFRHEYDHLKN